MFRIVKKGFSKNAGLPPGALVHIGERIRESTEIKAISYNGIEYKEEIIKNAEECSKYLKSSDVSWINVDGIHEIDVLDKVGQIFCLHPLVVEDILNTNQRPKIENYGDYVFIVSRMIYYNSTSKETESEQLSMVVFNNIAITFQEKGGDVFEPLRDRLRKGIGKIRTKGVDYLAYSILDAIVDNYFLVLEDMGEGIEKLENKLIKSPSAVTLKTIHRFKREIIYLHKAIWPLREVLGLLERGGTDFIKEPTQVYFRDVYDHTIQLMDIAETYKDTLTVMIDIYLSTVSNKMNEVMKMLTIISTIFMPLTFIVGVYGMNFKKMPELEWDWGYPSVWGIILTLSIIMVIFFKKKKWI